VSTEDDVRLLLGAYVLGGLDADDRDRVERHLPTCPACRDELARLSVVPGLLRLAAPYVEDEHADDGVAPEDGLAALRRGLADERRTRRRRVLVAMATAAAVVAILVSGVALVARDGGPQPSRMVAADGSAAAGAVALEPKPWGSAVLLDLTGLPAEGPFTAVAIGTDGARHEVASWGVTPTGVAVVQGASPLPPDRVSRVEVRASDGQVLLAAAVSAA
jgi:hypothetical protein